VQNFNFERERREERENKKKISIILSFDDDIFNITRKILI
jgi:hypothetical protein